jgi:hypothetical protein
MVADLGKGLLVPTYPVLNSLNQFNAAKLLNIANICLYCSLHMLEHMIVGYWK